MMSEASLVADGDTAAGPGAPVGVLRVRFSDVDVLPSTPFGRVGPVSDEFVDRGVTSFGDAARWLRASPYGLNSSQDAFAVFRDGVGTCTTKHAAIVTLAGEVGVGVQLVWGLYPLDDSIIAGAGAVLAAAGVPFVPNVHCFVDVNGAFVDLTDGNCTGKRRMVEDYLSLSAVDVGADEERFWSGAVGELCDRDPRFGHLDVAGLRVVLADCLAANPLLCARPDD